MVCANIEQSRELFEAFASDNGKWMKAIERDEYGNYRLLTTSVGWLWWQAADNAARHREMQLLSEIEALERLALANLKQRKVKLEESTHTTQNGVGGNWLTVVYRDIQPGDEAHAIADHPKVSALSWSHALHDRDAAIAAHVKHGCEE